MNFNSAHFMIFLPVVLTLFYIFIRIERLRELTLLAASYYFYMSWDWKYGLLLFFVTGINYLIGLKLETVKEHVFRKYLLVSSLVLSLGLLFIFKYFNFFTISASETVSFFGLDYKISHLSLLLPVGISFYTFMAISYTIDVYLKKIPAEHDLMKFSLYVSFFPYILSGPITRASSFLPQLHNVPTITDKRFLDGCFLIFKGLFKKIIVADLLATFAIDQVFSNPSAYSSIDLIFALYGYTFQIYNDFSGYTDIAIGAGLLLGYDLPQNFNKPYLSQNIREFWRRWHITLSTWFRDYLYIPLGGNRGTTVRVMVNLLTTMLLCGLWHGAGINFIIWGGYHGMLLIINHLFPAKKEDVNTLLKVVKIIICFHFITFGWLIFRVSSMDNFVDYIQGLFSFTIDIHLTPAYFVILSFAVLVHYFPVSILDRIKKTYVDLPIIVQAACYAGLIIVFSGLNLEAPNFIYFQF